MPDLPLITIKPISADEFAPFGDIIDASGKHDVLINGGACERFNNRARLSVDNDGSLGISVFRSECFSLPLRVDMMERHPLGSQAFIPMSSDRLLVVVAPDLDGMPGVPHAFATQSGQGINLLRGTWHGVLTPLGSKGLFAVIDRIGPGDNCETYHFSTAYLIQSGTCP